MRNVDVNLTKVIIEAVYVLDNFIHEPKELGEAIFGIGKKLDPTLPDDQFREFCDDIALDVYQASH